MLNIQTDPTDQPLTPNPADPFVPHDGKFLTGMEDPQKIKQLLNVEPPPGEPTSGNAAQSVLEMFDEIHRSMPEGAFDALPTDGARNYKHYLYGFPKEDDEQMTDAAGEVFADTGYWIAMHNTEDEWHWRAREAAASLVNKRIITSEMVLVEFLNFCSRSGVASRRLAAITVRQLWDNPGIEGHTSRLGRATESGSATLCTPTVLDQRWSVTDLRQLSDNGRAWYYGSRTWHMRPWDTYSAKDGFRPLLR